ncbi:MAG: agmatine deiminase family protein [Candidatus Competibacteraceae bacterium]|nr:agmatine deiminase family protein [Candidatus Competibacteraceae bacterium]MBK8963773.1 agmatine deiminase family protein [Candidatus Competibacteraceae bacterium]MBK9950665.1 agmatine deiminase family protein [Candidatus Competibacteraceae bacterium]
MSQAVTFLPAEWAPQDAILLTWPHADSDWRHCLSQADRTFAVLAAAISRHQTAAIGCRDDGHRQHVHDLLHAAGADFARCRLFTVASNDIWARDHGPIAIYRNGQPVLLDFRFNGWGGKFPHELDDRITVRLHALGAFGATPLEPVDLILEGGSIETDGAGTLLTTTQCLLNPNRNGLDRATLEQRLGEMLGINRYLWLENGYLLGDDTDSHIDTLARFCDARTLAYQGCTDPTDPHYAALQAMAEELRSFRTASGEPYRLIELPLPAARHDERGNRLPAGYANFLIVNGAVLVPAYGDPLDAVALERLSGCFPNHEIKGVPCATLVRQGGSLHCATMQLPAGVMPAAANPA